MPMSIATAQYFRRFIHVCRRPGVIVAALLLLGTAARLRQYLAATSYWHDEAYLLLNVFPKSFLDLVGPLSHDQAAPPLFLWMLRTCYLALGPMELAMRLPALVASLAALALMVQLAREIVGRGGWLFAVGCAAMSSSLLHLAHQVKPYTTDVLVAEAVLLAIVGCLKRGAPNRYRKGAFIALAAAAVIGPWLSFPSVFVTSGGCLALLCSAVRSRLWGGVPSRRLTADRLEEGRPTQAEESVSEWSDTPPVSASLAATVLALLFGSCLALWLLAARYHNTDYQQSFWAADFVDLSGPFSTLAWLARKLIEAGNYGMHGTGIPMALLAALGLAACWRRQPWVALALALPAALACVAAATKHYPLGNRLLAFLLPCLWLLAAQGVETVLRKFQRRATWIAAVPVLLLLPAAVYTARYSILAKPSVEFREALAYIQGQMREGDSLWLSQPEVYEVYFGPGRLLDVGAADSALATAARRGRVWMLCHPPSTDTHLSQDARRRLQACGALPIMKRNFVHLDVTLFSPAGALLANKSPDCHVAE